MATADSTETNGTQQTEQEEQQTTQPEGAATEGQTAGETPGTEGAGTDEAGDVVVTIGDASPASDEEEQDVASAPDWVKNLRTQHKEQAKRIRDLEAEIAKRDAPAKADDEAPGEKPTLEGCEYDADKFEAELIAWQGRKAKADDAKAKREKAEQDERQAWQAKLDGYSAKKTALKVADFEDAEEVAKGAFSVTQQGILLQGADNPALLVYALGKNPEKAKELAAITDPVQFAFAAAKLEAQLKVSPKRTLPAPERKLKGDSHVAGADAELTRLEAEADRTGDRSKVLAYKRRQREQAAG